MAFRGGREVFTNSIGMELKLLGPGTFFMGDEHQGKNEVTVSEPFRLGIYPVTQAEYERVMGKNPSKLNADHHPVEQVTWFNAIEFCNRLSEQEGVPPYYKRRRDVTILGGAGYRLPTEAEWEYTCRAGSEGAYCFGGDVNLLHRYAWFCENSGDMTHPVGQKQPNAWGFYDMHGNVWEWCWDLWDAYRTTPQEKPARPSRGSDRVFRGGSWLVGPDVLRSAIRKWNVPDYQDDSLGFRVARTPVRQD